MDSLKQLERQIRLLDLMQGQTDGWGHTQGREVHARLLSIVEANPAVLVFQISLSGINRTDASFPRESVLQLAKRYRGQRGFCLIEADDEDLMENWDMAASKLEQPLFLWRSDSRFRLLGPPPPKGNEPILAYALSMESTTASKAAKTLDLKVNNASMKLKQLLDAGYLLRREEVAETGGVEFTYFRIA